MTDIVFTIRISLENNKKNNAFIRNLDNWLSRSYREYAIAFLNTIISSVKTAFDGSMTTELHYSLEINPYDDLRHPVLKKGNAWYLEDIQIKNKKPIRIRLENQWIKGRVEVKNKSKYIIIEPENVVIPISESLFLKW